MKEAELPPEPPVEEGILCTGCVQANPAHAAHCAHCGAPLSSLATFHPFEQTLLEGSAYRRAVDGPPSRIVLFGIWLLFAPVPVTVAVILIASLANPASLDLPGGTVQRGFWLLYALLAVVILIRATANYRAKRRAARSVATPSD